MKAALKAIPRDEDGARAMLERLRWPDGKPTCPHCGGTNVCRLQQRADSTRPARKGLLKCRPCRKQFSVTVGTIFEDSHIPLSTWLVAIRLLCSSKKGMSAHQLHRLLGITYKSAWFMAHRIRYAMTQEPLASKLSGVVEVDETYVGGKRRNVGQGYRGNKTAVMALVERGGNVRAFTLPTIYGDNLKPHVKAHVTPEARVMTDSSPSYKGLGRDFAEHSTVNHSIGEYVRGDVTTNTVEGFFRLFKRGVVGAWHHISPQHMDRYLAEFIFRWDRRKMTDAERAEATVRAAEGKRLTYRAPVVSAE